MHPKKPFFGDLSPRTMHGSCQTCGSAFTWTAKGGRGAPRLHCSDGCATLAHDVERVIRDIQALVIPPGATREAIEQWANTLAGAAADLRGKAPKAPKKARGQIALFAPTRPLVHMGDGYAHVKCEATTGARTRRTSLVTCPACKAAT